MSFSWSMSYTSNTDTVKSTYFAYFLSVMKYGIIFWGNSINRRKIFTLQKKIIRIMASVKPRNSCRSVFKRLEVLTIPCKYIFSLLNFIVNNQGHFHSNLAPCSVNMRNRNELHRPTANY
jgi:hypothetical protein